MGIMESKMETTIGFRVLGNIMLHCTSLSNCGRGTPGKTCSNDRHASKSTRHFSQMRKKKTHTLKPETLNPK